MSLKLVRHQLIGAWALGFILATTLSGCELLLGPLLEAKNQKITVRMLNRDPSAVHLWVEGSTAGGEGAFSPNVIPLGSGSNVQPGSERSWSGVSGGAQVEVTVGAGRNGQLLQKATKSAVMTQLEATTSGTIAFTATWDGKALSINALVQ